MTSIDMSLLGYYLSFALIIVLMVIGLEIRRLIKKRRQARLKEQEILKETVEIETKGSETMILRKPGKYSLTWHHIAPEIKKGHVIRVQGQTGVECPFELVIEAKDDLSLQIIACVHGQTETRSNAGEQSLINLYQGMHAVLRHDEDGSSHLVCGPSGTFKQDTFWLDETAQLVVENHLPKRQVGELRVYYKFEEPTVSFVALAPAAEKGWG